MFSFVTPINELERSFIIINSYVKHHTAKNEVINGVVSWFLNNFSTDAKTKRLPFLTYPIQNHSLTTTWEVSENDIKYQYSHRGMGGGAGKSSMVATSDEFPSTVLSAISVVRSSLTSLYSSSTYDIHSFSYEQILDLWENYRPTEFDYNSISEVGLVEGESVKESNDKKVKYLRSLFLRNFKSLAERKLDWLLNTLNVIKKGAQVMSVWDNGEKDLMRYTNNIENTDNNNNDNNHNNVFLSSSPELRWKSICQYYNIFALGSGYADRDKKIVHSPSLKYVEKLESEFVAEQLIECHFPSLKEFHWKSPRGHDESKFPIKNLFGSIGCATCLTALTMSPLIGNGLEMKPMFDSSTFEPCINLKTLAVGSPWNNRSSSNDCAANKLFAPLHQTIGSCTQLQELSLTISPSVTVLSTLAPFFANCQQITKLTLSLKPPFDRSQSSNQPPPPPLKLQDKLWAIPTISNLKELHLSGGLFGGLDKSDDLSNDNNIYTNDHANSFPELTSLKLDRISFGDVASAHNNLLAGCPKLVEFDVSVDHGGRDDSSSSTAYKSAGGCSIPDDLFSAIDATTSRLEIVNLRFSDDNGEAEISLRDDFFAPIAANLKQFHCSMYMGYILPPSLWDCPRLENVAALFAMSLESLPGIERCESLKVLNLYGGSLFSFPPLLPPNLEIIHMKDSIQNKTVDLSSTLGLTRLKRLSIAHDKAPYRLNPIAPDSENRGQDHYLFLSPDTLNSFRSLTSLAPFNGSLNYHIHNDFAPLSLPSSFFNIASTVFPAPMVYRPSNPFYVLDPTDPMLKYSLQSFPRLHIGNGGKDVPVAEYKINALTNDMDRCLVWVPKPHQGRKLTVVDLELILQTETDENNDTLGVKKDLALSIIHTLHKSYAKLRFDPELSALTQSYPLSSDTEPQVDDMNFSMRVSQPNVDQAVGRKRARAKAVLDLIAKQRESESEFLDQASLLFGGCSRTALGSRVLSLVSLAADAVLSSSTTNYLSSSAAKKEVPADVLEALSAPNSIQCECSPGCFIWFVSPPIIGLSREHIIYGGAVQFGKYTESLSSTQIYTLHRLSAQCASSWAKGKSQRRNHWSSSIGHMGTGKTLIRGHENELVVRKWKEFQTEMAQDGWTSKDDTNSSNGGKSGKGKKSKPYYKMFI